MIKHPEILWIALALLISSPSDGQAEPNYGIFWGTCDVAETALYEETPGTPSQFIIARGLNSPVRGYEVHMIAEDTINLLGGFPLPHAWEFGVDGCQGESRIEVSTQRDNSGCTTLTNTNNQANVDIQLWDRGTGPQVLSIEIHVEFDLMIPDPGTNYSLAFIEYDLSYAKHGESTDSLCGGLQRGMKFEVVNFFLLDENLDSFYAEDTCPTAYWGAGYEVWGCPIALQTNETSWGRLKSYYR